MSNLAAPKSMNRRNRKNLALTPAAPKPSASSNNDDQQPGWGFGGSRAEEAGQEAQLEIGIEFNLSLRQEDLEIVKELGSGNGGTVSKVKHLPTGTTMARKVCPTQRHDHSI
jgi:mitogen-activated protein kinase kinase